jgi:hypothetical protein
MAIELEMFAAFSNKKALPDRRAKKGCPNYQFQKRGEGLNRLVVKISASVLLPPQRGAVAVIIPCMNRILAPPIAIHVLLHLLLHRKAKFCQI